MLLHKYWVTILNTDMFLEQQIFLLEWFLKGHVTLKTGVMAAIYLYYSKKWQFKISIKIDHSK